MNSSTRSAEPPLAAAGGIKVAVPPPEDPYALLDDLMVVVEALCPVWPARKPFADGVRMLM